MRIRPAAAEDADAVFAMLGRFAMSYEPDRGAFDRNFAAMLGDERIALLVAGEGDALTGYVMAVEVPTLFANGPIIQIGELFVEEAHRGNGTGRTLVDAIIEWALELDAAEVTVPTRRAGAYYERLGFERAAQYYHRRL